MKKLLEKFKKDGYVKSNYFGLNSNEAIELSNISKKLFQDYRGKKIKTGKLCNYSPPLNGSEVIFRFPEHNKKAFEIIERILNNKNFKFTFEHLLGKNYKLRDCSVRRSLPGDKGLYLHQDAIGETNLSILLSNNPKGLGSTCFLPGSHLIKTRMKEWGVEAPTPLVRLINFVFSKTPGNIGDCYLFFNRTWHGRSSNKSNLEYDVILMSFFPNTVEIPRYNWSPKFVKSIKNSEFSKLINFKSKKINNFHVDKSYVTDIECNNFKIEKSNFINIYFTIYFLRTFFAVFRPIFRLLKYKFKLVRN